MIQYRFLLRHRKGNELDGVIREFRQLGRVHSMQHKRHPMSGTEFGGTISMGNDPLVVALLLGWVDEYRKKGLYAYLYRVSDRYLVENETGDGTILIEGRLF